MDLSLEGIRHRTSVRSFDGKPLSPAEVLALESAFDECVPGPFGGCARFILASAGASGFMDAHDRGHSVTGRIGTYGLVTKVPAFLVGAIQKGPGAFEDFGFAMEGLALRAADLGLDSCWIGGVFDRSAASRILGLRADEYMPAIVAIGRPAAKQNVAELLVRKAARAGTRKPFDGLFFDGSFDRGFPDDDAWSEVLECVRVGPSASNKQPWRILRVKADGSFRFHFYLEEDRIYNSILHPIRIQNIDMGIAMRHFEAAARSLNLPGDWVSASDAPGAASPRSYVATWEGGVPS